MHLLYLLYSRQKQILKVSKIQTTHSEKAILTTKLKNCMVLWEKLLSEFKIHSYIKYIAYTMYIYLRQSRNICWNALKFIATPMNTTIKVNKDKLPSIG